MPGPSFFSRRSYPIRYESSWSIGLSVNGFSDLRVLPDRVTPRAMTIPIPMNEPVRSYEPTGPGETHRRTLKNRLKSMATENVDIPCVIGGKEVRTAQKKKVVMPHSHREVLGEFSWAGPAEM